MNPFQLRVSATPKDAVKRLTVNWKAALDELKAIVSETKRDQARLSPEAKQFLSHKYVQPMKRKLEEVEKWLA